MCEDEGKDTREECVRERQWKGMEIKVEWNWEEEEDEKNERYWVVRN
jgi:hypothetical protein